jgi:CBS domain-containing protein
MIGGVEILEGVLKNPTSAFFDDTNVQQIMNTDKLLVLTPKTTLSELLRRWSQTRRAFAIIPNQYHGYSVISARKLLEIGSYCKTDMTISSIPKREIVTFKKSDSLRKILTSMFENQTRKLVLYDSFLFISDRIIMQKIARELNCLRDCDNFLDMKAGIFKLEEAKRVSRELKINEAAKIMYDMQSPYLMVGSQVITPWDIAMSLSSDRLSDYDWQSR